MALSRTSKCPAMRSMVSASNKSVAYSQTPWNCPSWTSMLRVRSNLAIGYSAFSTVRSKPGISSSAASLFCKTNMT
ncbi:hypothetical protein THIOM_003424 [Candidatus Thiomargarita nelsonii]|uniref:Uncharacterized protein n=1 Tax=Candidatus Thiomargarita nelsonii TaxID=1003181 RepID=A0A176RYL3_9GAMM|nr:hypothetical protein THIOM_003424 [Candidatus Thiomargarita nelsonii]